MKSRPLSGVVLMCFGAFLVLPGTLCASGRKPVSSKNGMVVSAESLATRAGVEILKKGGNAIDAAVAVGFTLAVTYPEAGNIGGGGFMLIRLADGTSTMIDFREKAPGRASRGMYLDSAGNVIPGKSEFGPLAAGVPGSVAGYMHALEKYGKLGRGDVMAHAISIAENGLHLEERIAAGFKDDIKAFRVFPSTAEVFTKNGAPYETGDLFRQPDLAHTLKLIAELGNDGFYRGETAGRIVAEMRRSGGIMSREDLANYRAVEREPLHGSYRGFDIITAAPPSAGGVLLLQILNMLECFDIKEKGQNSSQTIHLFAAAAQRAFADRSVYLGDPDFADIPVDRLISKKYARRRAGTIDSLHATASPMIHPSTPAQWDQHETTHFCVADKEGNVVSVTTTLNGLYGCKTVVGGAGFFLNNEMDDFVSKPGVPNMFGLTGGEANAIAPDKRMLSSMTPTIVMNAGKPWFTLGARGGSRIPTAVANIIMNVIDFGLNIEEAVESPRVHHQWLPDKLVYEPRGLVRDVMDNLRRMGYALETTNSSNARAEALMIDPATGLFLGGPDPREEGVALGY